MKFAICLRGILYRENHFYNEKFPPYKIDFCDTMNNFQEKVVDSFRQKGHMVDVYLSTYPCVKLVDVYMRLQPKRVKLREFQEFPPGTPAAVFLGIIESLEMIVASKIEYDYVILTRFDLYWLMDVSSLFFVEGAISILSPGDDNFIVVSGNLVQPLLKHYKELLATRRMNHEFAHRFHSKGHPVHILFPSSRHCVFRCTRESYTPKSHPFYQCDIQEYQNPSSPFFVSVGGWNTRMFSIDEYKT